MKRQELTIGKQFGASTDLLFPFHNFLLLPSISWGSTHSSESRK